MKTCPVVKYTYKLLRHEKNGYGHAYKLKRSDGKLVSVDKRRLRHLRDTGRLHDFEEQRVPE
jgi:hypothetical protein